MKNITISLAEDVHQFTRTLAAKNGKSVSAYLSNLLKSLMESELNRDSALEKFKAREPYLETVNFKFSRDEIHEK
jgi:hypothetical protein